MTILNVPRKVRPPDGLVTVRESPAEIDAQIRKAQAKRSLFVTVTEMTGARFTIKWAFINSVEPDPQERPDLPNIWDWDTEAEHVAAGERLKRWRNDVERLREHPDLQAPEDREALSRALREVEQELRGWSASRRRRQEFQRRGLIPPD